MIRSKQCLVVLLVSLLCSTVTLAQSLKSIELDSSAHHLVIQSVNQSIKVSLPIVSYRVGDKLYTTDQASSLIEVSMTQEPFDYGIKGTIVFKNISKDTLKLHNVVPLGESEDKVYITGKGNHELSRTYLFRPGYDPLNVIVPDNAWNLGFTLTKLDSNMQVAALVRRNKIEKGTRTRFENFIYPGGTVSYHFWMDQYEGDWQEGMRMMFQKRFLYDVPVGTFDETLMKREDLKWIRSCYAINLMMCWDKRFYNNEDASYHVKDHLEKMKKLMGGYDVYSIWPTWPALGMDQRNQWDMFADLPGGYKMLRKISDICHEEGARFTVSYNPWDGSTRAAADKFKGMTSITKAANIDGFVLDTQGGSSKMLQEAADAARPGVVMYSEGMAVPKDMQGIVSGRVHNALYYPPVLNLNKLIKPDFAIFRVAEEGKEPIHREFNLSFFNGYGTEMNNFGPGQFEWSDDQMRYWGKLLMIQRENSDNFLDFNFVPLVPTLQDHIYVNRWTKGEKTIYTILNLKPEGFLGYLFEVKPQDGYHFVDIYAHKELEINDVHGKKYVPIQLEAFNTYDLGTNNESSVSAIAKLPEILKVHLGNNGLTFSASAGTRVLIWAGIPSYEKVPQEYSTTKQTICIPKIFKGYEGKFIVQAFNGKVLLDERIMNIPPGSALLLTHAERTDAVSKTPKGMVAIPAGNFQCDDYRVGDSFIAYPDALTKKGEKVHMKKFFMDRYPVTNAQFKMFLDASHYQPKDTTNFLKQWINGKIVAGQEDFPVTYVTLEDAQAYCKWAGKRIPTEMEWQYAAQTTKGNAWPWVQKTPVQRKEEFITNTLSVFKLEGIESGRCNLGDGSLYSVGKYPKGKNPYGLYDLVGCVWQLTSDVYDNSSYQYIMVKGGSYFLPSSSWWYVQGGPRELNYRQYLLRLSPSFERKATVGFRCVKDFSN